MPAVQRSESYPLPLCSQRLGITRRSQMEEALATRGQGETCSELCTAPSSARLPRLEASDSQLSHSRPPPSLREPRNGLGSRRRPRAPSATVLRQKHSLSQQP